MSGVMGATAATAAADEQERFGEIATALQAGLLAGERFNAWLEGESSAFVRMNRGKVRQAGHVEQRYLRVQLIGGQRHAEHTLTLSGDASTDAEAALAALRGLRNALPELGEDPHLLLPDRVESGSESRGGPLPDATHVVDRVIDAARGQDLVGIYAAGPVWRAFANSEGQRNWHSVETFNLDWSLYHRGDKAVKAMHAGLEWSDAAFDAKMQDARDRFALIARAPKSLAPGRYRAWLAPSALEELVSLLRWGAFSGRALATKQSALTRMESGEKLDPRVTIAEEFASGVAPRFQSDGFIRPDRVPLIQHGTLAGSLVSPRTEREFGMRQNGANASESPEAISMEGGMLDEADALVALDRGLWIGNLWYMNYSDRNACRMTGMTRFATFWVEGGKVVAPIDVMRFDDSLYRMLGSNLEALSSRPELMLSPESYGSRQLTSVRLPGALVSDLTFTL